MGRRAFTAFETVRIRTPRGCCTGQTPACPPEKDARARTRCRSRESAPSSCLAPASGADGRRLRPAYRSRAAAFPATAGCAPRRRKGRARPDTLRTDTPAAERMRHADHAVPALHGEETERAHDIRLKRGQRPVYDVPAHAGEAYRTAARRKRRVPGANDAAMERQRGYVE